jgi:hypothetical protein
MRNILLGMIVAAGVGLAGTAGVSAAPISGIPLGEAAAGLSDVQTVQHWPPPLLGPALPLALQSLRPLLARVLVTGPTNSSQAGSRQEPACVFFGVRRTPA